MMVEEIAAEGSSFASWTVRGNAIGDQCRDEHEFDAAQALLQVSPAIPIPLPVDSPLAEVTEAPHPSMYRPRSGSVGLDALADVAVHETEALDVAGSGNGSGSLSRSEPPASSSSSRSQQSAWTTTRYNDADAVVVSGPATSGSDPDSDDSEAMPPPPRRRPRSVSNPEGMFAWGDSAIVASSVSLNIRRHFLETASERSHFLLPTSLLEEELAHVSAVVQQQQQHKLRSSELGLELGPGGIIAEELEIDEYDDEEDTHEAGSSGNTSDHKEHSGDDNDNDDDDLDEEDLDPDSLVLRARARLLEDLLEGRMGATDKGVITLPHALDKYKNVYNQNGRVGIYTPGERAAIIARFQRKRGRRVWNKKIRYNCRKSLADRRLRVKGRFVKRSEQEQLARDRKKVAGANGDEMDHGETRSDEEMPNVNDPEAGFAPTVDQPYRRLRRHTVT